MNQNHPAAIFEKERNAALLKKEFPFEVSDELMNFVHKALESCSIMGMRAPEDQYRNIIKMENPFNMIEIQLILNIMIGSTPKDLGHSIVQHLIMLETLVYPLRNQWKEVEVHISRKIESSVQARVKMGIQ